jgi:hypothetical protein
VDKKAEMSQLCGRIVGNAEDAPAQRASVTMLQMPRAGAGVREGATSGGVVLNPCDTL